MKFYLAMLVWLLIAVVLGWAILTAVQGSLWFLLIVMLALVVWVGRTGCKVH
jgi:hypothetical protein